MVAFFFPFLLRPLLDYVGSSCVPSRICALCYAACRFSMRLNLFAPLSAFYPVRVWPPFAIRQKFPSFSSSLPCISLLFFCFLPELFLFGSLSGLVFPRLGLSQGWQMVLIWLMNVLIKQNRHLARPEWPAFDLGQKQSRPEPNRGGKGKFCLSGRKWKDKLFASSFEFHFRSFSVCDCKWLALNDGESGENFIEIDSKWTPPHTISITCKLWLR